VPWVVLAGVALSLFTPVHTLAALAWPFVSALVLPPLLWQVAVRLATAQFVFTGRAGLAWLLTALLIGLAMVAVYGYSVGLWPTVAALPAPLNRRGIFLLMAGALLLLGWQAHVPLTVSHAARIGLGMVAAAVGVLLGRWLAPVPEEVARSLPQALLRRRGRFSCCWAPCCCGPRKRF
jgi:hypothetical protein